MTNYRWGIDLGGTKVEGIVLEAGDDLRVIARKRIPTEAGQGYDHIVGQIVKLIALLENEVGAKADSIGIGTPGTIEPSTQLLKNSNTTILNGMPFKRDVEKGLGVAVKMSNDANCFAIAETMYGTVKDHLTNPETTFGIIMGTGVGGGLVVRGQVLNGIHGIAGEWGHNFLDESGGMCYCGRIGCVEQLISGPALQRYYHSLSGRELFLKDIVELAQQGDRMAQKTLDRLHHFFGKAVAYLINILDPDAIILGGGVGNIDSLYSKGVEEVKKYVFNPILKTLFLKPKLGDSAGVFGAALL